jgi:phosphoglycerate dehydrogenase-like enzyme
MDEIFSAESRERLEALARVVWGRDEPVPDAIVDEHREELAAMIVGWDFARFDLLNMPRLRTIIGVTGALPGRAILDYDYCFTHRIRVLGCAPAFGPQVAEMGVGLTLDACREISAGDAAFRRGDEKYLWDGNVGTFTLFDRTIGFVGYGGIAREIQRLLAPWRVRVLAYDPWLSDAVIRRHGAEPMELDSLLEQAQVVYVVAMPTAENRHLLDREKLSRLAPGSVLVVLSRAHLVDFDAMADLLHLGRFRAAIDVFDPEPVPAGHPIRTAPNTVLSAHRAGSVKRDLQEIGRMVVDDLGLILSGLPPAELQAAQPEIIARRGI